MKNSYKGYPFKTLIGIILIALIALALVITKNIIALAFLFFIPDVIESLDNAYENGKDNKEDNVKNDEDNIE